MTPDVLASDLVFIVPNATLYHFGVMSSSMHMAWVRQICGRLKSDYRYSSNLVYNNYPWPDSPSAKQRAAVERAAQAVLDARTQYLPPKGDATLADLYDPISMPAKLVKAHSALDRAVDLCYRPLNHQTLGQLAAFASYYLISLCFLSNKASKLINQ